LGGVDVGVRSSLGSCCLGSCLGVVEGGDVCVGAGGGVTTVVVVVVVVGGGGVTVVVGGSGTWAPAQ
jgi:hypothetical protein